MGLDVVDLTFNRAGDLADVDIDVAIGFTGKEMLRHFEQQLSADGHWQDISIRENA
jgi:hypothetical protein